MKYQVRIAAGYKPSGIFSFASKVEANDFITEWLKANNNEKSAVTGPIPL